MSPFTRQDSPRLRWALLRDQWGSCFLVFRGSETVLDWTENSRPAPSSFRRKPRQAVDVGSDELRDLIFKKPREKGRCVCSSISVETLAGCIMRIARREEQIHLIKVMPLVNITLRMFQRGLGTPCGRVERYVKPFHVRRSET